MALLSQSLSLYHPNQYKKILCVVFTTDISLTAPSSSEGISIRFIFWASGSVSGQAKYLSSTFLKWVALVISRVGHKIASFITTTRSWDEYLEIWKYKNQQILKLYPSVIWAKNSKSSDFKTFGVSVNFFSKSSFRVSKSANGK